MTEHYTILCETVSRIIIAPTAASVWSSLKDLGGQFGYAYLMAAEMPVPGHSLPDSVVYSDWRKPIVVDYARALSHVAPPFVRYVSNSIAPFTVTELRNHPDFQETNWIDDLPDVMRDGDGLIVPVHRANELMGGMVFGGQAPDASPLARSSLQVASHAAVERVDALKKQAVAKVAPALSAREMQCLSFIASGHEDEQISQLLGISPRTVRFHVDSAKTKLGVSSRVQAVTKAMRERIISV
jgi:DNA-binding CsgD family transcriptional regulator